MMFMGMTVILLSLTGAKLGACLSLDYYAFACPFAEFIVRDTVNRAIQRDMSIAAGLLRMHFHDCFVEVSPPLNHSLAIHCDCNLLFFVCLFVYRDAMDRF